MTRDLTSGDYVLRMIMIEKPRSTPAATKQLGFSLMELLVSMSLMTIVMGAAFMLLGRSMNFANVTYQTTEAEQTLRSAHEILNRDLTTAGDGLRGMNMIKVPVGFVQNYLSRTPVVDPSTPNYPNLGIVTADNDLPANTAVPQSNPSRTVLTGSDRITMLVQDITFAPVTLLAGKITYNGANTSIVVPPADISRFQPNEIYAIVSGSGVAFGVISSINTGTNTLVLTNGDAYGINETGSSAPIFDVVDMTTASKASTLGASIIRLQIIHYFISNDKLLIRRVFGTPGGIVDSVVAEHVANLQLRYLLSTDDPNGFVSQPVDQLSLANQAEVRQVETTIVAETARPINNTNSANNGYQQIRSTLATTVRNLQFREAL